MSPDEVADRLEECLQQAARSARQRYPDSLPSQSYFEVGVLRAAIEGAVEDLRRIGGAR